MANILIVDDSRTSRKILRGLLEANGYVVVGEAKNGQEGYDMYAQYKPDLVTMDITMPVMSGVDSLQSGAAEFIAKPFDVETIKNVLKTVLEG